MVAARELVDADGVSELRGEVFVVVVDKVDVVFEDGELLRLHARFIRLGVLSKR